MENGLTVKRQRRNVSSSYIVCVYNNITNGDLGEKLGCIFFPQNFGNILLSKKLFIMKLSARESVLQLKFKLSSAEIKFYEFAKQNLEVLTTTQVYQDINVIKIVVQ